MDEYINRVFRSISLSLDFLHLLLRNSNLQKPARFSSSGANISGGSFHVYRVHPHVPSLTTTPPSPHNRGQNKHVKIFYRFRVL